MDEKESRTSFDRAAESLGKTGETLKKLPLSIKSQAQEIRLRLGRPVAVSVSGADLFVTDDGFPAYTQRGGLLTVGRAEMDEAFRLICSSSVYSHQQEIRNGFVTIRGGHRAGICGTAVLEDGTIRNIRDISSVNLRIAKQIRGAADETAAALFCPRQSYPDDKPEGDMRRITGALIAGPPGCGKTTILRDLARQLSEGRYGRCHVAVVDERGEIAAAFLGMPQNDLGPCCDILDGYPKGEGILQAIRCMSPDVVICDEVGSLEEAEAILSGLNAGVAVIASAHASCLRELYARPPLRTLLLSGAFQKAVMLAGHGAPGRISAVYGEGELNDRENSGIDSSVYGLRGGRPDEIEGAFRKGQTA